MMRARFNLNWNKKTCSLYLLSQKSYVQLFLGEIFQILTKIGIFRHFPKNAQVGFFFKKTYRISFFRHTIWNEQVLLQKEFNNIQIIFLLFFHVLYWNKTTVRLFIPNTVFQQTIAFFQKCWRNWSNGSVQTFSFKNGQKWLNNNLPSVSNVQVKAPIKNWRFSTVSSSSLTC